MKPDYPISNSMQSLIDTSRHLGMCKEAEMLEELAIKRTTFCVGFFKTEVQLSVYRDDEPIGREYRGPTLLSVLEQERRDREQKEARK